MAPQAPLCRLPVPSQGADLPSGQGSRLEEGYEGDEMDGSNRAKSRCCIAGEDIQRGGKRQEDARADVFNVLLLDRVYPLVTVWATSHLHHLPLNWSSHVRNSQLLPATAHLPLCLQSLLDINHLQLTCTTRANRPERPIQLMSNLTRRTLKIRRL